jgi:leader peptidase (prepilin peptidase) / N-methyltransferase
MPADLALLAASFPGLSAAAAFVLGACVGSFLNVVVSRVPAGRSIVRPGSHCACGQPIPWRHNLPLVSWLILRGRARCCGRRISARYPLVEWLTAGVFLGCWLALPPAQAVCGWIFLGGLIGAAFIDLERLMIPDALTLGLGGVGVALSFLVPALHGQHGDPFLLASLRAGADSLEGLLVGSGLVFWIAMLGDAALGREAMGFGDVKFVGAIGAFCGWHGAVFAVFGGAFLGTAWLACALVADLLARKAPSGLRFRTQVPFGPMLAAAAALYFLSLHGPIDAWFAQIGVLF